MQNFYSTLGLNSSASASEIRRAYRILARRYHPDLNPGRESEERFKKIAHAYGILGDAEKREAYDRELERAQKFNADAYFETLRKNFRSQAARPHPQSRAQRRPSPEPAPPPNLAQAIKQLCRKPLSLLRSISRLRLLKAPGLRLPPLPSFLRSRSASRRPALRVSVIEVSLSMRDAVRGVKKTIEISEPEGSRKISVKIPAGVKNGSVVRLRATNQAAEELVLIVRLAAHPLLSIENRGLILSVPITVGEALNGANITIPTLEEPVLIRVPPGTQSGQELRLRQKGVAAKDSQRGDLFVRFMIRIPESPEAVGLKDRVSELENYYGAPVRQSFPTDILDLVS